jgi:hypothetical protein
VKSEVGIFGFGIVSVREFSFRLEWKRKEALMKAAKAVGTSRVGNVSRRT